jgi:AcrR family transcriptional regulator
MTRSEAMSPSRRYAGNSAEERRDMRREKILAAAIQVYGEHGYRASTVQAVCDAAGLTKRYFYESYRDSEDLLAACLRQVVAEFASELAQAAPETSAGLQQRARLILRAYFQTLKEDPPRARLFLLDTDGVGSDVAEAMRDAQSDIADLLVPAETGLKDNGRASLQRLGAVAGMARISSIWDRGRLRPAFGRCRRKRP